MSEGTTEFVTVMLADQLFGIPIADVQDVFSPHAITRVPLAHPDIAGVLNLRGRIVTAIDMRARLSLPPAPEGQPRMAVGVERKGEAFGLVIDAVGEVLALGPDSHEANPVNLDPRWREVVNGVYRLDGRLLAALDVGRLLEFAPAKAAA